MLLHIRLGQGFILIQNVHLAWGWMHRDLLTSVFSYWAALITNALSFSLSRSLHLNHLLFTSPPTPTPASLPPSVLRKQMARTRLTARQTEIELRGTGERGGVRERERERR